jgi:hypothetical protein
MRCHKCGKAMKYAKGMTFNKHKVDGWRCICGEEYFNPEQAQLILLLNKLKRQRFKLKLSQVRSNLILRIPKEVGEALNLHKGEEVYFSLDDSGKMKIETCGR